MLGGGLGGYVKARRIKRQIVIEVPANPNVTKLKGCCYCGHTLLGDL
jgi:hypothetical protein